MAVFYCPETLIILPQSGILNRICLGNAGVLPLDGGMCVKRLRRMGSAGLAAALLVFCVSGCSTIPKELLTGSSEAPAPGVLRGSSPGSQHGFYPELQPRGHPQPLCR